MTKSQRQWVSAAAIAALLCALGGAVCLSLALIRDYDIALGHFRAGSGLHTAAAVLCALGCLAGIPAAITVRRTGDASPQPSGTRYGVTLFSTLAGLLFVLCFLFTAVRGEFPESTLERIRLVLLVLSAGYFLLLPSQKKEKPLSFMILSLIPILYGILSVLCVYFNSALAMNAPMKTWGILLHLAMSLYFTCEARYALDRVKPPYFALLGIWAAVLGIAAGGAQLFAAVRGILPGAVLENAAVLALGLLAAARVLSLGTEVPEETDGETPEESSAGENPPETDAED